MSVSFVVGMDRNRGIGYQNKLPWRLPADLAGVKQITMGKALIMGRKTFESIGKPLPGRTNVILTQNRDYTAEGCHVVHTVQEAMDKFGDGEMIVFGGAEIYRLFLPYVDKMYITQLEEAFETDTFFPEMNMSEWTLVSRKEGVLDEKNRHPHAFLIYEKKD